MDTPNNTTQRTTRVVVLPRRHERVEGLDEVVVAELVHVHRLLPVHLAQRLVEPGAHHVLQVLLELLQLAHETRVLVRELLLLRGEIKGSTIGRKMGTRWDSRAGPNGHQPTANSPL